MNGREDFNILLKEHIRISRIVSKHFLKIGKKETSTYIEHDVVILDGSAQLKTVVHLLPHRRIYTNGGEKFSNPHQVYEMEEDIEV